MEQIYVYVMQILFVAGITYGSQSLELNNKNNWAITIVRYVLYILIVRGMRGACMTGYTIVRNKTGLDAKLLEKINRHHVMMFIGCIALLLLNDQKIIDRNFFIILIASLLAKFPEVKKKAKVTLSYGVGMASSYFEGYLVHVLPSDGSKFFGFEENIRVYQDREGVVFPVKKLFVIVTKSLYSPPALKDFNKSDRDDIAMLEACSALSEIEKDVAGVRNRVYKNTAYKIYRPNGRPIYLAVEGGTPMHTFYRVLKNSDLSDEVAGIDREEVVTDFLSSLRKLIANSHECRDKCEVIYFDDTDRNLNLADVLLDRIRELEPNFEEIIARKR